MMFATHSCSTIISVLLNGEDPKAQAQTFSTPHPSKCYPALSLWPEELPVTFYVLECFLTVYFLETEIMSVPDCCIGSVGITLSNAQELTSKPSVPNWLHCLSELHGVFLKVYNLHFHMTGFWFSASHCWHFSCTPVAPGVQWYNCSL